MKRIIVLFAVFIMVVMLVSACNAANTGSSAETVADYENDGEIIVMSPTQNSSN